MFTKIEINNQTKIVALTTTTGFDQNNTIRKLNSGGAYEMKDDSALDQSRFVDLAQVSQNLQTMIKDVSGSFIERDELVEAFVLGMVAGEHTFALSPPGTAKTAVASHLVAGVDGNLWRTLMNPDLTRDSLLGMIDPFKFQNGEWSRQWAGLATADIAIVDEIWKGSGQNNNILLDVLQERRVREGDTELHIPLLSVLSMSNEIPQDSERQAVYDRFLIRLTVSYMKDRNSFRSMLTADAGGKGLQKYATIDQLRLMAATAELMALNPPKSLVDVIEGLWSEMQSYQISDRRWRNTIKLACAHALLYNRQPSALDAKVAMWTLWSDPTDESDIRKLVLSKCDPFAGNILDLESVLDTIKKEVPNLKLEDFEKKASLSGQVGKLIINLNELSNQAGIDRHLPTISKMQDGCEKLVSEIMQAGVPKVVRRS